jgi:hypothetical protein
LRSRISPRFAGTVPQSLGFPVILHVLRQKEPPEPDADRRELPEQILRLVQINPAFVPSG